MGDGKPESPTEDTCFETLALLLGIVVIVVVSHEEKKHKGILVRLLC